MKATAPPRKRPQVAEKRASEETVEEDDDYEVGDKHVSSVDLGEVLEGYDEDPKVEREMKHWGGFNNQHHDLPDEKDYELEETLGPGDDVPVEEAGREGQGAGQGEMDGVTAIDETVRHDRGEALGKIPVAAQA